MLNIISKFCVLGYLDPGSGSALIGTFIAAFGAILYTFRTYFYKVGKGKTEKYDSKHDNNTLVIFSEGKNYWSTFRPIVEELLRRKIYFRYLTLDLYDPALKIESPYMNSKLYFKEFPMSFVKLSNISSPLFLATTPNIGTPGYPLKRSKNVKCMVHVFHAFTGMCYYSKGSLDHYDCVITLGDHQNDSIRNIEKIRNIPQKELIPLGLLYIDDLISKVHQKKERKSDHLTVLVGSSWGAKGCLREYRTDFIHKLSAAGFHIIIRPHPQSLISEPEFIEKCIDDTKSLPNLQWDMETTGDESMRKSDILISDTSSIRFDYAFLYQKPVITLDIPIENQDKYEISHLKKVWIDDIVEDIGCIVKKQDTIVQIVNKTIENHASLDMSLYRNKKVANFGKSAPAIVDYINIKTQQIVANQKK